MRQPSRDSGSFEVALVGRRLLDNENLGLGYLQTALAGEDTCQSPDQVQIVIDATGKVQDVIAEPPPYQPSTVSPEVLACEKKALQGLVFPCLAGLTVCPEYVIIE
jgi:hypothetical protein